MLSNTTLADQASCDIARRLIENGYMPVPIYLGQKAPNVSAWQSRDFRDFIFSDKCNIGIRCGDGNVAFLDVDVYCPELVSDILHEWFQRTGNQGSRLQRTGLAPKTGILFRTDEGTKKMAQGVAPTGKAPLDKHGRPKSEKIEVLATGQQFVAYGIHPDTQQPYRWHGLDPADNFLGRVEDLPYVSTTEVAEFLAWVAEEFGPEEQVSRTPADLPPQPPCNFSIDLGDTRATPEEALECIRIALATAPNNLSREDWIKLAFSLHAGFGDALHDDFIQFSCRYSKGDCTPRDAELVWKSTSQPSEITNIGPALALLKAALGETEWKGIWRKIFGRREGRANRSEAVPSAIQKERREFRLIRVGELEFREPEYLLPPMLEADALTLIFGEPGCGKSFLALDIAARVSLGVIDHAA